MARLDYWESLRWGILFFQKSVLDSGNVFSYFINEHIWVFKMDNSNLNNKWIDLAPDICRQRIVVEGTLHTPFKPEDMTRYCEEVTKVLNMTAVTSPVCNYDSHYGWCAYMHWKESGMHIYGWDSRNYKSVTNFTKEFFGDNLMELTWKE